MHVNAAGETPPYHYGTHYSSAMIVASYLLRMEPFTQTFLKLQGGHFDLADRMFHSVRDAWTSASRHNMADVKELIPEFFYLPEFLLNSNNFDLGELCFLAKPVLIPYLGISVLCLYAQVPNKVASRSEMWSFQYGPRETLASSFALTVRSVLSPTCSSYLLFP